MRTIIILILTLVRLSSYGANFDSNHFDKMVTLVAHKLHIRCLGKGKPTVMPEAGSGAVISLKAHVYNVIINYHLQ